MPRGLAPAVGGLMAALWVFSGEGLASEDCSGQPGCANDKVAVIRCDTASDGTIKVRNSSVTSASSVTIQREDRCAGALSKLLNAGLRIVSGPRLASNLANAEVSFNFVLVGADEGDDDDGDDNSDDSSDDS